MLRLIRGKRLSNIYNYRVLKRIYKNAKVKNIGYRKQGRNVTPSSMPIKTTQAKLMQTAGQINRVMRTEGEGQRRLKKIDALIQRYHILEKEIFEIWKREKQERWEQWIQKLNVLDHKKATREFYSEIKRKIVGNDEIGPIVNEEGKLSATLNERLQSVETITKNYVVNQREKKWRK